MRRYFFVLRRPGGKDNDPGGTLLSGDDAACAFGQRIVRELKEAGGYDDPDMTMDIMDSTGATIHSIQF